MIGAAYDAHKEWPHLVDIQDLEKKLIIYRYLLQFWHFRVFCDFLHWDLITDDGQVEYNSEKFRIMP